jgi:hypothetical protein
MRILLYPSPRQPAGCLGRCLVHLHAFGHQLTVVVFEIAANPGSCVAEASEAIAAECLHLFNLDGCNPDGVLWIEAHPPAGSGHRRGCFAVDLVAYDWSNHGPMNPRRCPAPAGITEMVRCLWYSLDGPTLANTIACSPAPAHAAGRSPRPRR